MNKRTDKKINKKANKKDTTDAINAIKEKTDMKYANEQEEIRNATRLELLIGILAFFVALLIMAIILPFISHSNMTGVYKIDSWNGRNEIVVIRDNDEVTTPNGKGTLVKADGKYFVERLEKNPFYILSEDKPNQGKIMRDNIEFVDGGILYNGNFFERIK